MMDQNMKVILLLNTILGVLILINNFLIMAMTEESKYQKRGVYPKYRGLNIKEY